MPVVTENFDMEKYPHVDALMANVQGVFMTSVSLVEYPHFPWISLLGVVNGPLKNEKSWQNLPKSRNFAQPTNGSRSLRFCVCRSHTCFSIKSLNFFVSVSDFRMPVWASRRVSDLPFATPFTANVQAVFMSSVSFVKYPVLHAPLPPPPPATALFIYPYKLKCYK